MPTTYYKIQPTTGGGFIALNVYKFKNNMSRPKGASLSDISASQTEERVVDRVSNAHLLGRDEVDEEHQPDMVVFKLANNKRKGRVHLGGIADIYNPETKKIERARLLAGVESIWMKDQKDLDKDYVNQNRRVLTFEGRFLRLPKEDTLAIQFARLSKHCIKDSENTGGMYAFFEWNPKRQAEAALAKRKVKIEAMRKAMDAPVEKMKKHAFYLGVSAVDEVGFPKKEDAIRDEYILKAEDNPELFTSSYDSVVVDISFLVKKALSDSKIDLGRERNRAYFSSGGFICSIPPQRNAVDALVDLATSKTPEGQEFLERLQAAVK